MTHVVKTIAFVFFFYFDFNTRDAYTYIFRKTYLLLEMIILVYAMFKLRVFVIKYI